MILLDSKGLVFDFKNVLMVDGKNVERVHFSTVRSEVLLTDFLVISNGQVLLKANLDSKTQLQPGDDIHFEPGSIRLDGEWPKPPNEPVEPLWVRLVQDES